MKEDTYMMHDIVSFVIRKVQIAIAFHHAVDSKRIAFDNCPEYWWFCPDVDGVNLSAIVSKNSTTLTSPVRHAQCNGVNPSSPPLYAQRFSITLFDDV